MVRRRTRRCPNRGTRRRKRSRVASVFLVELTFFFLLPLSLTGRVEESWCISALEQAVPYRLHPEPRQEPQRLHGVHSVACRRGKGRWPCRVAQLPRIHHTTKLRCMAPGLVQSSWMGPVWSGRSLCFLPPLGACCWLPTVRSVVLNAWFGVCCCFVAEKLGVLEVMA